MIRNIVLVKLKAGLDPAVVAKAQQAFLDLNCPGTLSYTIGDDLGLRAGNWSFAIVADFTDAEAYRGYDRDPVHNQARAGLLPLTEQIARLQFEMPLRHLPPGPPATTTASSTPRQITARLAATPRASSPTGMQIPSPAGLPGAPQAPLAAVAAARQIPPPYIAPLGQPAHAPNGSLR